MPEENILKAKYRKIIKVLALAGLAVSIFLVIEEIRLGDYCPCYPLLGWPACYLVLLFFIFVLAGSFVKSVKTQKVLILSGSILGLSTAIWFSTHQILKLLACPQLFGIPLCYLALITFLAILTIEILTIRKSE